MDKLFQIAFAALGGFIIFIAVVLIVMFIAVACGTLVLGG